MKMKLFKNILLVVLVLFTISCSDFLEEKGYKTDYSYYETADGLNALTTACYQNTRWMANGENIYCLEDMGSDLFMIGGDGGSRDAMGQYLSNALTPQYSLLSYFWGNNYPGIYDCNLGLQYLAKNTDMTEATKTIRKGEMLFLRAYYYSQLVTQFGDIPLTTTATSEPKTDYYRVPQKEVWAQIISDLREAWDLLPWADGNGEVDGDYGRVGKGAVGHLLAQVYMFRYCDIYTKNESDPEMDEDRGGKTTDLDSVIYYASRVCNFGEGNGSGSIHKLAANYATLTGWDQKTGVTAEYMGPEVLFSINFSTTAFYNNADATDVGAGNQLHMYYNGQNDTYNLTTKLEDGTGVSWLGNGVTNPGVSRTLMTGRPWRRISPTPYYFSNNGLYASRNYESGIHGKLIDSRLYKSFNWVYYCNTDNDVPWTTFSNAAGSFDPASIGKTVGAQRFELNDTAVLYTIEDVSNRPGPGTKLEKLALARAKEKYWIIPMASLTPPATRGATAVPDAITNQFPSSAKFLDNRRASTADMGGFRNFHRMRLGETFILLSEAYARKGQFDLAAQALNEVRSRAAWGDGEVKYAQYWKYDGGTYDTRTASTVNDMKVSSTFLGSFSGDALTNFYLDEYGHEVGGELNRFSLLVRFGADFWYNRVKADNYWVNSEYGGNIKVFHRFRPIPQSHIDAIYPADPDPQNYGY
jgi:starch-binding outer membrane protein, SusD/RagB family